MTDVKRYLQQIKLYDSHINTKLDDVMQEISRKEEEKNG